jgi:hypothetical protein
MPKRSPQALADERDLGPVGRPVGGASRNPRLLHQVDRIGSVGVDRPLAIEPPNLRHRGVDTHVICQPHQAGRPRRSAGALSPGQGRRITQPSRSLPHLGRSTGRFRIPYFALTAGIYVRKRWSTWRYAADYSHGGSQGFKSPHLTSPHDQRKRRSSGVVVSRVSLHSGWRAPHVARSTPQPWRETSQSCGGWSAIVVVSRFERSQPASCA